MTPLDRAAAARKVVLVMGCHDPHPSNTYYKYLRVDSKAGKDIDAFCAACHSSKADPGLSTTAEAPKAAPAPGKAGKK